jgi:hypothetical protein
MATQPVPILDENGWLTEPAPKADQLMAWYFVSEESQTSLYLGSITSLPAQIQKYGNDPLLLQTNVGSDLEKYFGRYFDQVAADITVNVNTSATDERMNLIVRVTVMQDNVNLDVGALVSYLNGKVVEIIRINNTGQ